MDFILDSILDLVNWLIEAVATLVDTIIGIFPNSPFLGMNPITPSGVNLGYITWFIPFPAMIAHATVFLGVVMVYYTVRLAARWAKLIRD